MRTCWEVPFFKSERLYDVLPNSALEEWAKLEIRLSKQFREGILPGISESNNQSLISRKKRMLDRIGESIRTRANSEFHADFIKTYRNLFVEHLEDPGLLHNFEFFCIPTSDFMIRFYLYNWTGKMAPVMELLHGYGENLKGKFVKIPDNDVWTRMCTFEGMCLNERAKTLYAANLINDLSKTSFSPPKITFFGGGNLPERFYGLPDSEITIFDDGDIKNFNQLFSGEFDNPFIRDHSRRFSENLLASSKHLDLRETQDLVIMHGVSMYLGPILTKQALLSGQTILKPGGYMVFDHILLTDSLERCLETQGWPKGRGDMDIYMSVDAALECARKSAKNAHFEIVNITPRVFEPWGVQSIDYLLRKIP